MQKQIITWVNLSSGIIILLSFGLDSMIMRFLLVGELPGSNVVVAPNAALALYAVLLIAITFALSHFTLPTGFSKKANTLKVRLPKKRFTSL